MRLSETNPATAIIPARYGSSRFPGKPLAMLGGKPVVQHVYERVSEAVDCVCVATDDERIKACVEAFGGRAVLTRANHPSGTDRCREAADLLQIPDEHLVLNIQGDEPLISAAHVKQLLHTASLPEVQIATLATSGDIPSNPNTVKVVVRPDGQALYFSRSPLQGALLHQGLYAYRAATLRRITLLPPSRLELAERLEQLRWLEAGIPIHVGISPAATIGIDTPDDLRQAEKLLAGLG